MQLQRNEGTTEVSGDAGETGHETCKNITRRLAEITGAAREHAETFESYEGK